MNFSASSRQKLKRNSSTVNRVPEQRSFQQRFRPSHNNPRQKQTRSPDMDQFLLETPSSILSKEPVANRQMPFESPLELQKRHNKNFSLDFLSLGGDSRLRKAKDVYKEPQRYVTETPVLSKKRVFTEKEPFYNEFNEFEEDNEPKRAQKRNISGNFDKSNDSPFLEECYYKPKRFIEEIQNRGLAGNSNHSDFRHNQLAKDRETSSKMESLENKIQKLKASIKKLENERKEQRKVVKKADILAKFNPMINLKAERIILNVSSDELKVEKGGEKSVIGKEQGAIKIEK